MKIDEETINSPFKTESHVKIDEETINLETKIKTNYSELLLFLNLWGLESHVKALNCIYITCGCSHFYVACTIHFYNGKGKGKNKSRFIDFQMTNHKICIECPIQIWDVETERFLAGFSGHLNWVRSAEFSSSGR